MTLRGDAREDADVFLARGRIFFYEVKCKRPGGGRTATLGGARLRFYAAGRGGKKKTNGSKFNYLDGWEEGRREEWGVGGRANLRQVKLPPKYQTADDNPSSPELRLS